MSERLALHLDRMLESANLAADYVRSLTREAFLLDRKTQQAVVLNLMVIGETVNRLQVDDPDFLTRHPALPWSAMRGMRNRIAQLSSLRSIDGDATLAGTVEPLKPIK